MTGKYTPESAGPKGPRALTFTANNVRRLQPLLGLMREIGAAHGGKSCAQVAINWCAPCYAGITNSHVFAGVRACKDEMGCGSVQLH